jgi:pyrroline-5-carboxylate reductase
MDKIIGFIGSGNMANAMVGGIINANLVPSINVVCSDHSMAKLENMHKRYGITIATNNSEVASKSDILILSVKPQFYPEVINEIKDQVKENTIVVSIAAGQKIESIKNLFGKEIKIVRAMPNTPALVAEGMAALSPCPMVLPEELDLICNIFNSFGKCEVVSEKLMDVVTGLSGSSPAFIFMIIEAMADGAVLEGMPRDKAYKFAAQTVLGSAKMVLETGKHPAELKDMVCSPGGTTIEGVSVLEQNNLRASMINAVRSATKKSKDLAK